MKTLIQYHPLPPISKTSKLLQRVRNFRVWKLQCDHSLVLFYLVPLSGHSFLFPDQCLERLSGNSCIYNNSFTRNGPWTTLAQLHDMDINTWVTRGNGLGVKDVRRELISHSLTSIPLYLRLAAWLILHPCFSPRIQNGWQVLVTYSWWCKWPLHTVNLFKIKLPGKDEDVYLGDPQWPAELVS